MGREDLAPVDTFIEICMILIVTLDIVYHYKVRYTKKNINEQEKSVGFGNFAHRIMLSPGLFFATFRMNPMYQSAFVMLKIYGKVWCIFIFQNDPVNYQMVEFSILKIIGRKW